MRKEIERGNMKEEQFTGGVKGSDELIGDQELWKI
tara:strand:+ start:609 stop:713 length:105 start_codon:yes stop_codon:yes gene_type:complete